MCLCQLLKMSPGDLERMKKANPALVKVMADLDKLRAQECEFKKSKSKRATKTTKVTRKHATHKQLSKKPGFPNCWDAHNGA